METHEVWIVVFLLLIMKIPIAYLCFVIWYAIKAEPRPEEGAAVTVDTGPDGGGSRRRRLPRFPRPHGSPARRYPRTPQPAAARMRADER